MLLFNKNNFLLSIRDSGYKNLGSAISELVDNSFEAEANKIHLNIIKIPNDFIIEVADDGIGMDINMMKIALQFGGTTRFNSRSNSGRYGMGLPNSALSYSRRVDLYSWKNPQEFWWHHLDLDEIISSKKNTLPKPEIVEINNLPFVPQSKSGTVVKLSKCDRLQYKHENKLIKNLYLELAQIFRKRIWMGKTILINGKKIIPTDPLFLRKGLNIKGGKLYGNPLKFNIKLENKLKSSSKILVTFTKLPIEKWHSFSNEEKRKYGITKKAGLSIIRANREIDYGWFFMGSKRKGNYDDWWRCEVCFEPHLDELFGVTYTKQGIRPTETLLDILSPDIERIARDLNADVRKRFIMIKNNLKSTVATNIAEKYDFLLEPPPEDIKIDMASKRVRSSKRKPLKGISYKIDASKKEKSDFFHYEYQKEKLLVHFNENHPFYKKSIAAPKNQQVKLFVELLIIGHARAECNLINKQNASLFNKLRKEWSINIANFIQSI